MYVFSLRIVKRLFLLALVCSLISCNKDEMMEETTMEPPQIELDKASLLNELTNPEAVNFFNLDFIELTNPHLSGEAVNHELTGAAESVYMDFLIKNGELDYVPDLIPEFGYPMWHRVQVSQDFGNHTEPILIPFADLETGKTNGLMIAIPRDDDLFYQEHNVNRSGYYYLTMTRNGLAEELEDLALVPDNVYAFLFHYLYLDEQIFNYRNEEWWAIWDDYDGLISTGNDGEGYRLGGQVTFRDLCSTTVSLCIPNAIISGDGSSGTLNDEVEFRDCTSFEVVYVWECPGTSGGYIPGGSTGNGGTNGGGVTLGSPGGYGSGLSEQLDEIIRECSSETSPDVIVDSPQHLPGNCAALLAAIENLGYSTLPPGIWLALFDRGGALLDEAGQVDIGSNIDIEAYILYLNYTLSGQTTQPLRIFNSNYRRVQELQNILEFNEATFQWLLDQSVSLSLQDQSVVDVLEAFLADHSAQSWLSSSFSTGLLPIWIDLFDNENERILATSILEEFLPALFELEINSSLVPSIIATILQDWNNVNYLSDFTQISEARALNAQIETNAFIEAVDNQAEPPKSYFNLYGYNGVTQQITINGQRRWVHNHWNYPLDSDVHYIYDEVGNTWLPYEPNEDQIPQVHFINALIGSALELGHNSLDLVGLIPGLGEVADGINVIWYLAEGDNTNATISAAAMVPFSGAVPAVSKYVRNGLRYLKEGGESVFRSRNGLKFKTPELASRAMDRVGHLFEHAQNDLTKAYHGVFDDPQDVIGIVDEAWEHFLSGSSNVISVVGGGTTRKEIVVNLERRIGWQGGSSGAGSSHDLTKVKIIIERGSTDELVTAYPF